jgi:peptidoglycan/xylan/chitin deacetylase (PgdA/CDA1 family)
MFRGFLKASTAQALRWTGTDSLIGRLPAIHHVPLVIGYHRVVEDTTAHPGSIPAMLISTKMLECHLDWIGRRFRFISLDELGAKLENGDRFEKPVAAVTFDDGYEDVYRNALPLLKRKGIPAAMFVVTDQIGSTRPFIYDRLYFALRQFYAKGPSAGQALTRLLFNLGIAPAAIEQLRASTGDPHSFTSALLDALSQGQIARIIKALEEKVPVDERAFRDQAPLTWDMLAEMQQAGITIGSHTQTHVLLTNESRSRVADEARGSRQALERRLRIPIKHFAYPSGKFNVETVETVAASGYRFGYTTCSHRDPVHPLLTIPRRLLWQNSSLDTLGGFSSAVMSCLVHRIFDLVSPCREDHGQASPAEAVARPAVAPAQRAYRG